MYLLLMIVRILFTSCFFIIMSGNAQVTSKLEKLLYAQGSPFLKDILADHSRYRYQLIYTSIDRNVRNRPVFTDYSFGVDTSLYFNPASTVKMPLAFLALEKINRLKIKGLTKDTPMLTDSGWSGQTTVVTDSTSRTGLPSIAHYIRKIFLVSDNDAYNRLYEFLGQEYINTRLREMGYTDARITRRFTRMTADENRHTNPIRFVENGKLIYSQPAAMSNFQFDFSRQQLIGTAHYDRDDKLVQSPMDFTTHNNMPLPYLKEMLKSVLFPDAVPEKQRFELTVDDYRFLYDYMSRLPSESSFPAYDTKEFFDSYTKFFFFRAGKDSIPSHIRSFNKAGWSYGFLTDVCYIIDLENNIEFMLAGNIYVNDDGVLNDDKYEYEDKGYPFLKEVGQIIYQYELNRDRKKAPDLKQFRINYAPR